MTVALSSYQPEPNQPVPERDAEVIELFPALRWHRRLQAGVALLALPLALAATVWFMGRPAAEARREPIGFVAPVLRVSVVAAPEITSVARRVASTLAAETTEVSFEADDAADSGVTKVVYYDPAMADDAAEVQRRLGAGTISLDSMLEERSADVTVVVGKDLAPA